MRSILRRLARRHATAVTYLALFAALGGSAYAAVTVTDKNIQDGTAGRLCPMVIGPDDQGLRRKGG